MTLNREQFKQLQLLKICPQKLRKDLLRKVPSSCIKAICECVLNLLRGNIPISEHQKSCLKKHKHTLRQLADRKSSLYTKRKLLVQKGGFLQLLLPSIVSVVSSLIQDAVR